MPRSKSRTSPGGGDHYEALVISASFDGKMKVARHRMVYGSLQDAMVERIHALKAEHPPPHRNLRLKHRN